MANAVITLTVEDVTETRRMRERVLSFVADNGDYPAGGVTLDLSAVENPNFFPAGKFGANPTVYAVENGAYFEGDNYDGVLIPGTDLTNWKLIIVEDGVEAGAVPAFLQSANDFRLMFAAPKNL